MSYILDVAVIRKTLESANLWSVMFGSTLESSITQASAEHDATADRSVQCQYPWFVWVTSSEVRPDRLV